MNKELSLQEAAARIPPRCILGLGGMTLYRRPVALVRAMLATDITDLTLFALTCGFESDLLVGAGRVKCVRTCYFGLEGFGLAPMFTQCATAGELQIVEETEASLAFGLRASQAGVGFMPSLAWLGTDLYEARPDVKMVRDPYSESEYTAFPAQTVDVALIHAVAADRLGNARLGGNLALDRDLAMVASFTIVTAEKLVDHLDGPLELPGIRVDAVVEVPNGAWPTSCYPDYPVDGDEILDYVELSSSGRFDDYLQRFLVGRATGPA